MHFQLAMLTELSKPDSGFKSSKTGSSIFQEDRFKLNLAGPRIFDDEES